MAWTTSNIPWPRQGNGARRSDVVILLCHEEEEKETSIWTKLRRGNMVIGIDKGEWIAQNKRRNGGGFGCRDNGRPWNQ
jgi:hypothetical protein